MIYPGFVGPSNALASPSVDSERTENWFLETTAPGTAKAPATFAPAPGFRLFTVLPSGPVRGLWSQDGRCYAVSGTRFCELIANQTYVDRGPVAADDRAVWMSSNGSAGHQVAFASGGHGYIFDTISNTLVEITDTEFPRPCARMDFVDGYFLALKESTNIFQWSALENGLAWDGLDVAQLSQSSDNLLSLIAVHGQVWLLGTKTSVVWADVGAASAFAPIPGSQMQIGTRAADSAITMDNALFWLGGNDIGQAVVFRGAGVGAAPQRVSTFAVEYALNNAPRLEDAVAWGYQENGHTFYILYVPTLPTAWAFDISTGSWHERSIWDPVTMRTVPDLVRCHTFCFGLHLVGDRQSNAVYVQDFNLATCDVVEMGA